MSSAFPIKVMERSPVVDSFGLSPSNVYGIEVELENLKLSDVEECDIYEDYWTWTEDGSLRNHGVEFVSRPLRGDEVSHGLSHLFERLPDDVDFNARAGIHVHVNCREFRVDTLRKILLTYYLFEDFFFSMVQHDRNKGIFCVPVRESCSISEYLALSCDGKGVQKYAALNILPLWDIGTIEFRHLHSTNDMSLLRRWFQSIDRLVAFCSADTQTFEDFMLNICNIQELSRLGYSVFLDCWDESLEPAAREAQATIPILVLPEERTDAIYIEGLNSEKTSDSFNSNYSVLSSIFTEDVDYELEGGI